MCLISFGVKAQFGYFNLKFYDSVGIEAPKLKIKNTIQGSTSDSLIVKTQSNFEIKRLAVNQLPFLTSVPAQSFSSLTGKPNTLSGYGITDAYPLTGNPNGYLVAAPVSSAFGRTGIIVSANGDYNTSQVTESTNLYYTAARFNTAFSGKSTTDLSEGTNQYFTNTRARSSISAGNELSFNPATGVMSKTKRTETYSGNTNASGLYTVTYATAYSVAPNVQFQIGTGGNNKETILLTSSTTTGFTVYVQLRADVLGLLPSYSNVSGRSVDVLITEK